MTWRNQMLTRIDILATAINDRNRKIDLHHNEIDGLNNANAADREELAALNAALGAAPTTAPEPKQLGTVDAVKQALEGMTGERPGTTRLGGAPAWGTNADGLPTQ